MTDNPLDDGDGKRNALIEKRAYHLWETGGRPEGQDEEFWERASELVRMEEAAGFGQLPNPATVPGANFSRSQPVEEAFIQENLGEFPDSLSDQGERAPTPRASLTHEEQPEPPAAAAPAAAAPARKAKGRAEPAAAPEAPARKPAARKPAKG